MKKAPPVPIVRQWLGHSISCAFSGAEFHRTYTSGNRPSMPYLCNMLKFMWIIICLTAFGYAPLAAQTTSPFDLQHRLPREAIAVVAMADSNLNNPFDVVPHRVPGASATSGTDAFRPFKALPRGSTLNSAFLFWALIILLGLLTLSVATGRKALLKAWNSFTSDNALAISQREASGLAGSTPYYLMYLSFLLNAGTFIFLMSRYFWGSTLNNLSFYAICVLAAGVVLLSKHLALELLSSLHIAKDSIRQYNFLIVVFNCILGLFLLPFNFMIAFSGAYSGFLIFWTLGLILIMYGYRALRAFSIGNRILAEHPFYFLLYLCTVEIAPLMLLLKIALRQS